MYQVCMMNLKNIVHLVHREVYAIVPGTRSLEQRASGSIIAAFVAKVTTATLWRRMFAERQFAQRRRKRIFPTIRKKAMVTVQSEAEHLFYVLVVKPLTKRIALPRTRSSIRKVFAHTHSAIPRQRKRNRLLGRVSGTGTTLVTTAILHHGSTGVDAAGADLARAATDDLAMHGAGDAVVQLDVELG